MPDMPASTHQQVLWLRQAAPQKPVVGQACNGCGVCCAAAPCPVALVFLWQRRGACRALLWDEQQQCYRCGMVQQPQTYMRRLPAAMAAPFGKLVRRWIAANTVCDSIVDIDVEILTSKSTDEDIF